MDRWVVRAESSLRARSEPSSVVWPAGVSTTSCPGTIEYSDFTLLVGEPGYMLIAIPLGLLMSWRIKQHKNSNTTV